MIASDPAFDAAFEANAAQIVYPNGDGSPFKPLDLQRKLADLLAERKRVIALQPTGAGKTLAATLPFAANVLTPAQMVFMTPMRSLTSAQTHTINGRFNAEAAASSLGLNERAWSVRQQTGTIPDDPDFEATITVATFDQALSSAVRLSYSASRRRRTVNAGAILSSYLVADELHLFPRGEALTTLLCLLKYRPPALPFLLMTATLTQTVAHTIADLLDATVFDDPLSLNDMSALGVTMRQRTVRWQTEPLTTEQIAQALTDHPDWRILVVVNTVQRAIELARAIDSSLSARECLAVLHARFYQDDRSEHEDTVMRGFTRPDERQGHVRIAVATQVVEVGLDISADLIFTELAPASALVQRWGRSARWGGEAQIVVAPPSPDPNARIYPYVSKEDSEVIAKTRDWLAANAGGSGILMDTASERALLDSAHREADEKWANALSAMLPDRASDIGKAVAEGRYDLAGALIRQIDTRTVLICGKPNDRLQQPFDMEGFSLAPGSLMPLLPEKERPNNTNNADETMDDDLGEGMISFGLPTDPSDVPWRLRYPVWSRDVEGSEAQANTVDHWEDVLRAREIANQPVLAINPALVSYDDFFGLSLLPGEVPVPEPFWAHSVERQRRRTSFAVGPRQSETYEQHIARMLDLYAGHPVLGPRLKRITPLVETWLGWPKDMLDRLIRAAIVAHDAGKLSPAWQAGIASYQQAINQPMRPWLVHTDDSQGKIVPWDVPPHALSGAAHSMEVGAALDDEVAASEQPQSSQFSGALPSNVLFTAIATHHTPTISDWSLTARMLLMSDGVNELNRLLTRWQLPPQACQMSEQSLQGCGVVQGDIASDMGVGESYALALVTRMLRLADSWSQDPDRLDVVKGGHA